MYSSIDKRRMDVNQVGDQPRSPRPPGPAKAVNGTLRDSESFNEPFTDSRQRRGSGVRHRVAQGGAVRVASPQGPQRSSMEDSGRSASQILHRHLAAMSSRKVPARAGGATRPRQPSVRETQPRPAQRPQVGKGRCEWARSREWHIEGLRVPRCAIHGLADGLGEVGAASGTVPG
jgi:hypothetical protein